jgi:triacylglycerol esterase/lipase EstA (alpha/beta hydrolase family)
MLAHYLRRILLTLLSLDLVLAYLLWHYAHWSPGSVAALALLLPPICVLAVVGCTAFLSRAGGSTGLWWRSLWGEYLATLRIFVLRQPWSAAQPVNPSTAGSTRIPVVLVHGYLCNGRIWDTMAQSLRAQGHAVHTVDLEPVFGSIDDYAAIVEAAVATLCQQTGAPRVALVGHSMGGLAIRAWLRAHGPRRAARVLTLGTPHAGTRIAAHSQTPNGRQMVWHSPWLADLAASESDAVRALLRVAITLQDNIVYPQRAQSLEGVTPTVFEGIGHLQMCLDAQVIHWVAGQLTDLPAR